MSKNHDERDARNRPAETLREGTLKATIWRNESESGPFHTVSLARTYKDGEGELRDSASFRAKDMLPLAELTRQAHYRANDLNRDAHRDRGEAQSREDQARDNREQEDRSSRDPAPERRPSRSR